MHKGKNCWLLCVTFKTSLKHKKKKKHSEKNLSKYKQDNLIYKMLLHIGVTFKGFNILK